MLPGYPIPLGDKLCPLPISAFPQRQADLMPLLFHFLSLFCFWRGSLCLLFSPSSFLSLSVPLSLSISLYLLHNSPILTFSQYPLNKLYIQALSARSICLSPIHHGLSHMQWNLTGSLGPENLSEPNVLKKLTIMAHCCIHSTLVEELNMWGSLTRQPRVFGGILSEKQRVMTLKNWLSDSPQCCKVCTSTHIHVHMHSHPCVGTSVPTHHLGVHRTLSELQLCCVTLVEAAALSQP